MGSLGYIWRSVSNLFGRGQTHKVKDDVQRVTNKHDVLQSDQNAFCRGAKSHIVRRGEARVANNDQHVGVENLYWSVVLIQEKVFFPVTLAWLLGNCAFFTALRLNDIDGELLLLIEFFCLVQPTGDKHTSSVKKKEKWETKYLFELVQPSMPTPLMVIIYYNRQN